MDIDPEKYIIQAKRYKSTVPVKEIREFKGTSSYEKRIFITTSDFSKSGIEEAENDSSRKIILINEEQILKFYNDIRARILPIPAEIFENIKEYSKYNVEIDGEIKQLNINRARRYFGGITDTYKKIGYYDYKGNEKKKSYWKIDKESNKIIIEFE